MNDHERVRYLRKEILMLTQEDFAKSINISRSNLGSIETGRVNLTERVLTDICDVHGINKDWLLYGGSDEDIKIKIPEIAEIAKYTQDLLEDEDSIVALSIKELIITYYQLDAKSRKVFDDTCEELLQRINKTVGKKAKEKEELT